jgi:hypothetical protein
MMVRTFESMRARWGKHFKSVHLVTSPRPQMPLESPRR